jgi:hypothetical protein
MDITSYLILSLQRVISFGYRPSNKQFFPVTVMWLALLLILWRSTVRMSMFILLQSHQAKTGAHNGPWFLTYECIMHCQHHVSHSLRYKCCSWHDVVKYTKRVQRPDRKQYPQSCGKQSSFSKRFMDRYSVHPLGISVTKINWSKFPLSFFGVTLFTAHPSHLSLFPPLTR